MASLFLCSPRSKLYQTYVFKISSNWRSFDESPSLKSAIVRSVLSTSLPKGSLGLVVMLMVGLVVMLMVGRVVVMTMVGRGGSGGYGGEGW